MAPPTRTAPPENGYLAPRDPLVVAESPPAEVVTSGQVKAPAADRWQGERIRTVCSVVTALVAGGAALALLKGVLTPLLIAIFLYYLMLPVTDWLKRANVPRALSAPALALALLLGSVGLGQVVYGGAVAVGEQLPKFRKKLVDRLDQAFLAFGYAPREDGRAFNHDHLDRLLAEVWQDNAKWLAESVITVVEVSLMALFYLLFLFIEAQSLPRRVYEAFRPDTADDAHTVGQEVNGQVKRYLLYKTLVNSGIGLSTGLICAAMGLEFWLLWAAAMFLLNYITYIGSIVALVPPVLLAVVQFDNPWYGLLLAGLLTVNRLVWIDFVEIRFLGNVLQLSPVVMLLSIAFFGVLWGPVGLLLAVPLMTSVKIVLAFFESTRHLAVLISEG